MLILGLLPHVIWSTAKITCSTMSVGRGTTGRAVMHVYSYPIPEIWDHRMSRNARIYQDSAWLVPSLKWNRK